MGRLKGSQNKKKSVDKTSEKTVSSKIENSAKLNVIIAAPLDEPLFLCRRCHGSFETGDEYKLHNCPVQVFEVAVSNDTKGEIIAALGALENDSIPSSLTQFAENSLSSLREKKTRKSNIKQKTPKKNKSERNESISCKKCNKVFTRKYHLERHLIHTKCNDGQVKREVLDCEVCGKTFSRIDNLRMHLKGHLGQKTRNRDFQCQYCEKSFYGSSLLNIHIRTHTREKPYLCHWPDCNKGFPSSGALTKHKRVHTGERPYACTVCSSRFSAKETLNRHVKIHTGRKDHVCKICGKAFIQNTQLKAHMFHHNGENAITCDCCGRQFNRMTRIREHIEYFHLKKPMPQCVMCAKQFMRKEDLNRHMDIHVGKRTHCCSHLGCEKKFVTKAAVAIHMRIHQVEPPSKCNICNKEFIRLDCLVRHMRNKHRDKIQNINLDSQSNNASRIKDEAMNNEQVEIIFCSDDCTTQDNINQVFEIIPIEDTYNIDSPQFTLLSSDHSHVLNHINDDEDGAPIFLNDELLMKKISELLQIVIEDSLLKELGFGQKSVDDVLCSVLEQCSRKPLTKFTTSDDESTRMRENTKQLFSMVLDEEHIKSLLNNYTVDEVITIVLKMAK